MEGTTGGDSFRRRFLLVQDRQRQNLRQVIERRAAFFQQGRVCQVFGMELVAVVAVDPIYEFLMKSIIQKYAGVSLGELLGREDDAEAQACGTASVGHALADGEEMS